MPIKGTADVLSFSRSPAFAFRIQSLCRGGTSDLVTILVRFVSKWSGLRGLPGFGMRAVAATTNVRVGSEKSVHQLWRHCSFLLFIRA
jgi:hypothetical protein